MIHQVAMNRVLKGFSQFTPPPHTHTLELIHDYKEVENEYSDTKAITFEPVVPEIIASVLP